MSADALAGLGDIEDGLKAAIGTLTRSADSSDAAALQAALAQCHALAPLLARALAAADAQLEEAADAAPPPPTSGAVRALQKTLKTRFGYAPPAHLDLAPVQIAANTPAASCTPQKPQNNSLSTTSFAFETPGGPGTNGVGGLVGSNDYEDASDLFAEAQFQPVQQAQDSLNTSQSSATQSGSLTTHVREDSDDEDDMSHLIQGTTGLMEQEEYIDPPSPTLESLGISSFGLGLLKGVLPSDPISQNSTPIPQRIAALRLSTGDAFDTPTSSTGSKSSPIVPEITQTPMHHQISDHNSIFGDLIRPVRKDEYDKISECLTAQISFDDFNDAIVEINEYITDKRFQGMGEDQDEIECLTIDELVEAGTLDSGRVKPVLVMLLELERLALRHGKYFVK